ncbi:MAG: DUF5666 domain-containing protein [Bellilinea sp.]|jgi:hypothetical protein
MNPIRLKSIRNIVFLAALALIVLAGCAPMVADASATLSAAAAQPGSRDVRLGSIEIEGTLEQISNDALVVDGLHFRVDDQSVVVSALQAGDRVQVKAVLLPDDSRYAQSVKLRHSDDGEKGFWFYGFVEAIGADQWVISSIPVAVNAGTRIGNNIQVGSYVDVDGYVINGVMTAEEIKLEDDRRSAKTPGTPNVEMEFIGVIESIQNGVYVISGKTVLTNARTEIEGSLAVGMKVEVHAALQPDGAYLAREIELVLSDDDVWKTMPPGAAGDEVEFIGVIESIQNGALVVGGKTLITTPSTEIKAALAIGVLVKVHAFLQPDGTYLAREIELTNQDDNSGISNPDDDDRSGNDDDGQRDDDRSGNDDGSQSDDDRSGNDNDDQRDDDNDDNDDDDDDQGKDG